MPSLHSRFSCFADVSAHLDGLGMFHMDFGLSRVRGALSRLGLVRPPYRVTHVVGTNGKGSVSLVLAETATAHGLRTGLYSSPHFVSPRERILVDGSMLSEGTWVRLGNEVLTASGVDGLTYFEFITVLAVLAFARAGVDLAVMEAGLGGRYDASTALTADLAVFTPMGLDHTHILGDTLEAVARDKAGALRPGVPAVTAPQAPEARDALVAEARDLGVSLSLPDEVPGSEPHDLRPAMLGPHQFDNARLALAAWRLMARDMGVAVDADACAGAVSRARLPGRMQRVSDPVELILDGAHNPHALRALAAGLEHEGLRPAAVVFACMRDKDLSVMAPMVGALTDGALIAVGLPDMERAMPAEDLAVALGPRARAARDLPAALAAVAHGPGPVLVCGSLYLLGEFFALRPDCLGTKGPDLSL